MQRIILTAVGAAMMVGFVTTDADAMRRGDNAAYEQRLKLKAEWQQSKRAGGYGNPLTALVNLFSGADTGNAIQPVINDPHSRGNTIIKSTSPAKNQ